MMVTQPVMPHGAPSNACPTPYKHGFPNEKDARSAIRAMQHRGRRGRGKYVPQELYKCLCGAIHLRHREGREPMA
ncbi:hypothetical protein EB73_31385 [Mycobacterium sp. SWH-M3]|nr:hypothetical protein EB73_31385 [Mycobacterium sp. SWH-M3]